MSTKAPSAVPAEAVQAPAGLPFVPALAARLAHIEPFHVMEIGKLAASLREQGRDLIFMSIGEPDFTAAPAVCAAAQQALLDGSMQYTAATGLPALQQAISRHYLDVYGLQVDPARIVVTAGASAALLLACAALVQAGDEVLMPDPSYPCNRHFIATFEGTAKLIPSGPDERFQLTADMVRDNWSEASKGVLVASPSNPTGTSIAPAVLREIVQEVRQRRGFVIVDEIYNGLSYKNPDNADQAPFSALALGDDVLVINSFSKYFSMTGWRLGWLVLPPSLIKPVEKLAQNLFICPSTLAQHAALACFLPESLALFEQRKAEFQRRRDYLVPALRELGFCVPVMPDGAFYVYADCRALFYPGVEDAYALVLAILHETGVVLVPGLDFGTHGAGYHIRISYATALDKLQQAVARLGSFFAAHRLHAS